MKNASSMKPGEWQLSPYGLIVRGKELVSVKHEITKNRPSLLHGMAEKLAAALKGN